MKPTPELVYLNLLAIVTVLMWVPYIRLLTRMAGLTLRVASYPRTPVDHRGMAIKPPLISPAHSRR